MKKFYKLSCLLSISIFFIIFYPKNLNSSVVLSDTTSKVRYQTNFGQCPSRPSGSLILKLIKTFEKTRSLGKIKTQIIEENLLENHFISNYRVSFDPLKNFLKFKFQCPTPLMKVQIHKEDNTSSHEAILTQNGKLLDPTYEIFLRTEEKLIRPLPYLTLPISEINTIIPIQISKMVKKISSNFKKKLSEIIINNKELILILSINNKPSSIFFGKNEWENKIIKLQKIMEYMKTEQKIPVIINLTNIEKIVVKFNGKF